MLTDKLIDYIFDHSGFKGVKEWLSDKSNCRPLFLSGLRGSVTSLFLSSIFKEYQKNIILLVHDKNTATILNEELTTYLKSNVYYFPSLEILPYDNVTPEKSIVYDRLITYYNLIKGKKGIYIVETTNIMQKVPTLEYFKSKIQSISENDTISFDKLKEYIFDIGYENSDIITQVGETAVRGGIIDIYIPLYENPIRIELFGDTVSSIREFNIDSQQSIKTISSIDIIPVEEFSSKNSVLDDEDKYFAYDYYDCQFQNFTSYFDLSNTILIHNNYENSIKIIEKNEDEIKLRYNKIKNANRKISAPEKVYINSKIFWNELDNFKTLYFCEFKKRFFKDGSVINFDIGEVEQYYSRFDDFISFVRKNYQKQLITIFCKSIPQRERLEMLFQEHNIFANEESIVTHKLKSYNGIILAVGRIASGYYLKDDNIYVFSDEDIFIHYRKKRQVRKIGLKRTLPDPEKLQINDFIVHSEYGIGKYLGIKRIKIDNKEDDFLEIQYAQEQKLFLPIMRINMIQKYIGKDGYEPTLNSLSGETWARTKKRVRKSAESIAKELVNLYAMRNKVKGYKFEEDTVWERKFELEFLHEETDDQLKSINEVKADMTSSKPMDRLLCGDVGFGKTEVAMRAAFKAVMNGKQVCFLAPTTILVQQHYVTFLERMGQYPINIDTLSRFKTKNEQNKIVKEIKDGNVDIIIGTHRLLQKDIKFFNLGLLVVDEEHRFGVKQKEIIKMYKKNIDVLTLTATPIPRTLYMSIIKIRDMSLITTPPKRRLPIKTFVLKNDDDIIREAVLRELNRAGQIFYLHNRVQTIETKRVYLEKLLPEARIAVAHGQMNKKSLEKIMLQFVEGKYDMLVCSSIIESGLDIPNVNTIIITEVSKFGLAQLYQLRGRVGRSSNLAYAYFLYDSKKKLTTNARKRLKTIEEYSNLSSGFKIALRDLEIRGAGNLLGRKQSGNIMSVGFDLYCNLIQEEIDKLKGVQIKQDFQVDIKLQRKIYLPRWYIYNENLRLQIYKRLASLKSIKELNKLKLEIKDRFGNLPRPVEDLFYLGKLRILSQNKGIEQIIELSKSVHIKFDDTIEFGKNLLKNFTQDILDIIRICAGKDNKIIIDTMNLADNIKYKLLEDIIIKL